MNAAKRGLVETLSGRAVQLAREAVQAVGQRLGILPEIAAAIPTLSVEVVRPEDLLVLRFEFFNLGLRGHLGPPGFLARPDEGAPAFIVLQLPPQAIAEEAFFESAGTIKPAKGEEGKSPPDASVVEADLTSAKVVPVRSRISGPSRLVFSVPSEDKEIPYTLEAILLACGRYPLRVADAARVRPTSATLEGCLRFAGRFILRLVRPSLKLRRPSNLETAIEVPYRLIVSPDELATWEHATAPVARIHPGVGARRTELWHTRLETKPRSKTMRAIWARDFNSTTDFASREPPVHPALPEPFAMSLDTRDRYELVRLTSDFLHLRNPNKTRYVPRPFDVDRLLLTPLGAWMDAIGRWSPPVSDNTPPASLTVEGWRHRTTMGRDHYAEVVYKGYLFPFRHRASLVKVTERKFHPTESGGLTAYLRQRMYVVIREPDQRYFPKAMPHERKLPFNRITITTLVTPDLDQPASPDSAVADLGQSGFWPQVGGADFLFQLVAEDDEGRLIEFTAPLIFVGNDVAHDATALAKVQDSYKAAGDRRTRDFHGQKIAFVPHGENLGDTSFDVLRIRFGGIGGESLPASFDPPFYPAVDQAEVEIPAIKQLLGARQPSGVAIRFHDAYLHPADHAGNPGQVFAELVDALRLSYPGDKTGALVTPNLDVTGLSRLFGPVGGDVGALASGTFDPSRFFSSAEIGGAKILGSIALADIVPDIKLLSPVGFGKRGLDRVPKLMSRTSNGETATRLEWETRGKQGLRRDPRSILRIEEETSLAVRAEIVASLDKPGPARYEVTGELRNFALELIRVGTLGPFLKIAFDSLTFKAGSGRKVDVSAIVRRIEFACDLEFVSELEKFIPLDGFNDPPSLEVSPQGVQVGYTVALPTIVAGMFSLQNVSLAAGLHLSFEDRPARLQVGFADRHHPFLLTVSAFGGGGFLALRVGLDKLEVVEGAFEFGGCLALNLSVASGGVYVMAGIYFKLESAKVSLGGYVRCGGALEVLGLVSVSVEFFMGLSYLAGKAVGIATLTVKVEVALFTKSVNLTVERQFTSTASDPPFDVLTLLPEWGAYREAFAPLVTDPEPKVELGDVEVLITSGFDRSVYPGNNYMDWLLANTNLIWVGFFLYPSPSRAAPGKGLDSWMPKRTKDGIDSYDSVLRYLQPSGLKPGDPRTKTGWGLAPLYVGRQPNSPANFDLDLAFVSNDTAAVQGATDAWAAADAASRAGFRGEKVTGVPEMAPGFEGTTIFLDIEGPPDGIQTAEKEALLRYYRAWVSTLFVTGYKPGVYCGRGWAGELLDVDDRPVFWIVNTWKYTCKPVSATRTTIPTGPPAAGSIITYPDPDPVESGVCFAKLWQYATSPEEKMNCAVDPGDPALKRLVAIDFNSGISNDPASLWTASSRNRRLVELYRDKPAWLHDWTSFAAFELGGVPHYLSYRDEHEDTADPESKLQGRLTCARIDRAGPTLNVETVFSEVWDPGWTSFMPFMLDSQPHYLAYSSKTQFASISRIDLYGSHDGTHELLPVSDRGGWPMELTSLMPFQLGGAPHFLSYAAESDPLDPTKRWGKVRCSRIVREGEAVRVESVFADEIWRPDWTSFVPLVLDRPGLGKQPHYLAYSAITGYASIGHIDASGTHEVYRNRWLKDWKLFMPFELRGNQYYLSYRDEHEDPTNPASKLQGRLTGVRIVRDVSTVTVETVLSEKWKDSGWTALMPFALERPPFGRRPHYLAYDRRSGLVNAGYVCG